MVSIPPFVAQAPGVLRAVGFHDQARADAKAVHDIGPDWDLPAEFQAGEAAVAQESPEAEFGLRQLPPHGAGAGALVSGHVRIGLHARCPHTALRATFSRGGRP